MLLFSTSVHTHYYLVIDEAHRGTGKPSREDQTIAQRLMNGDSGVTAAPVVLGITATPERFDAAVQAGSQERVSRKVIVPIAAVRESGLLKDVLSISYRGAGPTMETTLVRNAVANLREMDSAWNAYTEAEGEPPVRPALVFQIPPNANKTDIGKLLDVCIDEWNVLGTRNTIAHTLESHTAEEFGSRTVNYVQPQNIQDHSSIRLVIFKEALTTGWDCPRAEVMVSLRRAKDDTYIAQLIGRMVRSPLARRIEIDESLNRVTLFLPHFDRGAVDAVKSKLESEDGGLPTDIEIDARDAPRNSRVPKEVFGSIEGLPSYQVPGPIHRSQVARLHKLAALLIGDGLLPDAIRAADEFLVSVLEVERARLKIDGKFAQLTEAVLVTKAEVLNIDQGVAQEGFIEEYESDIADVNHLFAGAKRKLRDGLAEKYWGSLVMSGEDPFEAKVDVIAISNEISVVDKVEAESADRVRQWLDTYGDSISMLSEDKKARYAEVRSMAKEPELVYPGLPTGPISMPGDESIVAYKLHLYSDANGDFRTRLGTWEKHVFEVESQRDGFVAWYRNPTGGQRAIRIPYETDAGFGKMYPDIVVIHKDEAGNLQSSIIDPHGQYLADAVDKIKGLASYAAKHGSSFGRILGVIRDSNGDYRMLDLKDSTIRSEIEGMNSSDDLEGVFSRHGSTYE